MVQSAFKIIKFSLIFVSNIFLLCTNMEMTWGFIWNYLHVQTWRWHAWVFFPNRPPTRWLTLNCYLFLNFDSIVPYTPKQYSSCIISFQNGFFSFGGIFRETTVNVYVTLNVLFSCLAIWFRVSKRIEKEDRGKNQINSKRPIKNNIFSSRIK